MFWCHHRNGHSHDDVIKWKHFPRYWPFVRGIHRSTVNSPHKGQRRGALMFSLICVWINSWVNNRGAGDLRRYLAHYDVTVMEKKLKSMVYVIGAWFVHKRAQLCQKLLHIAVVSNVPNSGSLPTPITLILERVDAKIIFTALALDPGPMRARRCERQHGSGMGFTKTSLINLSVKEYFHSAQYLFGYIIRITFIFDGCPSNWAGAILDINVIFDR